MLGERFADDKVTGNESDMILLTNAEIKMLRKFQGEYKPAGN